DYSLRTRFGARPQGICTCVGGPSVFYGGASFRFREADFGGDPLLTGASGAAWPIGYADLEEPYTSVEQILGVAGDAGVDPTEPPRGSGYPLPPLPLAEPSRRVAAAAATRG